MLLEEGLEEFLVGHDLGVEHDLDHFRVAGHAGRRFVIGRVGGNATGITDRGHVDAGDFPEQPFGAPEAAHAEIGRFEAFRIRTVQRAAVDEWVSAVGIASARPGSALSIVGITVFF